MTYTMIAACIAAYLALGFVIASLDEIFAQSDKEIRFDDVSNFFAITLFWPAFAFFLIVNGFSDVVVYYIRYLRSIRKVK